MTNTTLTMTVDLTNTRITWPDDYCCFDACNCCNRRLNCKRNHYTSYTVEQRQIAYHCVLMNEKRKIWMNPRYAAHSNIMNMRHIACYRFEIQKCKYERSVYYDRAIAAEQQVRIERMKWIEYHKKECVVTDEEDDDKCFICCFNSGKLTSAKDVYGCKCINSNTLCDTCIVKCTSECPYCRTKIVVRNVAQE